MHLIQMRLVIQQIQLRRAAALEQKNHPLGARAVVQLAEDSTGLLRRHRMWLLSPRARTQQQAPLCFAPQQVRERQTPEPHAKLTQPLAARHARATGGFKTQIFVVHGVCIQNKVPRNPSDE